MERAILHVDLNNFYASVECLFAPHLRNVPMAVAGNPENRHGIILAKNNIAKSFGVKTAEAIWQARRKCPNLVLTPPQFARYHDYAQAVKRIYAEYTGLVESFGLDECWLDVTGSQRLFGRPTEIAEEIRARVKEELGLTVSIGVSFNKIFAKLGSDFQKPDAVTVFSRDNYQQIVWNLPASSMLFVGPTTEKILNRCAIRTIGDSARADQRLLSRILGKNGEMLWSRANGLDHDPVAHIDAHEAAKSVGNSATLPIDIHEEQDVRRTMLALAQSVASRLRSQRVRCRCVQITIRNNAFKEIQRQRKITPAACDAQTLFETAMQLYHEEETTWKIRLLGLRAVQLVEEDMRQQTLFPHEYIQEKRLTLETAVEQINRQLGRQYINRAIFNIKSQLDLGKLESSDKTTQ